MTRRPKPKALACPTCGSRFSTVQDSGDPIERQRAWKGWSGAGLWRLRKCHDCGALFTTDEVVTGLYPQRTVATS